MWIAVDAMGGDQAPGSVVEGAHRAASEDGARVLLVGHRDRLSPELRRLGLRPPAAGAGGDGAEGAAIPVGEGALELVHAEDAVGMDEPATTPLRRKPDSSIRRCVKLNSSDCGLPATVSCERQPPPTLAGTTQK
jgi:glycerol-3-phosphate acyltransferase PlsX